MSDRVTTVLMFGDIFGRPGRKAIISALPELKAKYQPDFILGNAENIAGGKGINKKCLNELYDVGFHGFTGGNHTWDNKEAYQIFESDPRVIRPANFPAPCPGQGFHVYKNNGKSLVVINLLGRVFMDQVNCPFHTVEAILKDTPMDVPILVDMHAEATGEKYSMGWFLDGRVAAVVGTHTHVQTADDRILPKGTGYLTDIGMTGSFNSVIGLRIENAVRRYLTKRPQPYEPAIENPGISCVVIRMGDNGKALSVERIRKEVVTDFDLKD